MIPSNRKESSSIDYSFEHFSTDIYNCNPLSISIDRRLILLAFIIDARIIKYRNRPSSKKGTKNGAAKSKNRENGLCKAVSNKERFAASHRELFSFQKIQNRTNRRKTILQLI